MKMKKMMLRRRPGRSAVRTNASLPRLDADEMARSRKRQGGPVMSDSETTTDHETIRKWADARGGRPATVKATEEDGHAGILRIDFGPKEAALDPIDWNEFFRKFDE